MRQKLVKVLELTVLMLFILATSAFAVVNMELILDASQSMNQEMEGRVKIDIAKETLINFLTELPDEVNISLRVYGTDSLKGCQDTKLLIPIKPIDKDALTSAIDLVEPRAMTPIAYSLEQAQKDFQDLEGEKIRVSGGFHSQSHQDIFRLSTGELLMGELLSFDGSIFKIKTEKGVVEKKKDEVVAILIGTKPLVHKGLLSQWASKARASSQYSPSDWSTQQATGEPNTSKCGDIKTAWAPGSSGDGPEWLEVVFDTPIYATRLRVHETYNAGFINEVEFVDIAGEKHGVWWGKDTTPCPGWFEININQTSYLVKGVILHTRIGGYEEIDAVELTGIVPPK